jgi:hypothetical protein
VVADGTAAGIARATVGSGLAVSEGSLGGCAALHAEQRVPAAGARCHAVSGRWALHDDAMGEMAVSVGRGAVGGRALNGVRGEGRVCKPSNAYEWAAEAPLPLSLGSLSLEEPVAEDYREGGSTRKERGGEAVSSAGERGGGAAGLVRLYPRLAPPMEKDRRARLGRRLLARSRRC